MQPIIIIWVKQLNIGGGNWQTDSSVHNWLHHWDIELSGLIISWWNQIIGWSIWITVMGMDICMKHTVVVSTCFYLTCSEQLETGLCDWVSNSVVFRFLKQQGITQWDSSNLFNLFSMIWKLLLYCRIRWFSGVSKLPVKFLWLNWNHSTLWAGDPNLHTELLPPCEHWKTSMEGHHLCRKATKKCSKQIIVFVSCLILPCFRINEWLHMCIRSLLTVCEILKFSDYILYFLLVA